MRIKLIGKATDVCSLVFVVAAAVVVVEHFALGSWNTHHTSANQQLTHENFSMREKQSERERISHTAAALTNRFADNNDGSVFVWEEQLECSEHAYASMVYGDRDLINSSCLLCLCAFFLSLSSLPAHSRSILHFAENWIACTRKNLTQNSTESRKKNDLNYEHISCEKFSIYCECVLRYRWVSVGVGVCVLRANLWLW